MSITWTLKEFGVTNGIQSGQFTEVSCYCNSLAHIPRIEQFLPTSSTPYIPGKIFKFPTLDFKSFFLFPKFPPLNWACFIDYLGPGSSSFSNKAKILSWLMDHWALPAGNLWLAFVFTDLGLLFTSWAKLQYWIFVLAQLFTLPSLCIPLLILLKLIFLTRHRDH